MSLKSSLKIDYTYLRDLLVDQYWFDAAKETKRIMLKVTHRNQLYIEDIWNFPLVDLRNIDKLWTVYSKGKFGFSIQKNIYQSLGGTDRFNLKVWKAFCERVGWQNLLATDSKLMFSIDAPPGHLPAILNYELIAFDTCDAFVYDLHTGHCSNGSSLICYFFNKINQLDLENTAYQ